MLILIAKGYTVTRGRLRKVTWIKIVILFLSYLVSILITFLYAEIVSLIIFTHKKYKKNYFKMINFSSCSIREGSTISIIQLRG
jgi:hypothetical protein